GRARARRLRGPRRNADPPPHAGETAAGERATRVRRDTPRGGREAPRGDAGESGRGPAQADDRAREPQGRAAPRRAPSAGGPHRPRTTGRVSSRGGGGMTSPAPAAKRQKHSAGRLQGGTRP